jgi:hypothetical protein
MQLFSNIYLAKGDKCPPCTSSPAHTPLQFVASPTENRWKYELCATAINHLDQDFSTAVRLI